MALSRTIHNEYLALRRKTERALVAAVRHLAPRIALLRGGGLTWAPLEHHGLVGRDGVAFVGLVYGVSVRPSGGVVIHARKGPPGEGEVSLGLRKVEFDVLLGMLREVENIQRRMRRKA
jgi:hypothetical protein